MNDSALNGVTIPPVAPGHIRLIGSQAAMARVNDHLEKLHSMLHDPNENLRQACIRKLAGMGITVLYGDAVTHPDGPTLDEAAADVVQAIPRHRAR